MKSPVFQLRRFINRCLRRFGRTKQCVMSNLHRSPSWVVCGVSVTLLGEIALYSDPTLTQPSDLLSRKVLAILFDRAESIATIMVVILFYKEAPNRKLHRQKELLKMLDTTAHIPNSQTRPWALETLVAEDVSLTRAVLPNVHLVGVNINNADLRDSNFEGANLESAKLSQIRAQNINLCTANLQNADLSKANLWKANLSKTNLQYANLAKSKLSYANLENANLQHADLTRTYMWRANLKGAKLMDTNLQNVVLWEANLENADLSGATNLTFKQLKGANLINTRMPDGFITGQARWSSLRELRKSLNSLKRLSNE
ncbi:MAG: pentapeptide repeat-containing protein [Cyanobacteria bacterium P01_D01_bin.156]